MKGPADQHQNRARANFRRRLTPGQVSAFLNREGFAFGLGSDFRSLPTSSRSILLASFDTGPRSSAALGLDLPRFASTYDQWLVATVADSSLIRTGIERMTSGGRWQDLAGQAVSLDTADGSFSTMQPKRVVYMLPDRLHWSDVRPSSAASCRATSPCRCACWCCSCPSSAFPPTHAPPPQGQVRRATGDAAKLDIFYGRFAPRSPAARFRDLRQSSKEGFPACP